MPDDELDLLLQQRDRLLNSGWRNFRDFRAKKWDPVIRRQATVQLEPHLKPWAEGLDIQSPDLEHYLNQIIQILMIRPTRIDAVPTETGDDVKKDVERDRMYYGHFWRRQNKGRRLDRNRAEGTTRYGFACERMGWEAPGEPDPDPDDDDDKANKARDKAMMERVEDDPFTIDPVHPLTVIFEPFHGTVEGKGELFIEESVIGLTEARNHQNDDGKYLDLTALGKWYFRGDKEPLQEWSDRSAYDQVRAHLITRAQRDPETGDWTLCEYVCLGTGGSDSQVVPEEGVKLTERVVPMGRCPYFIIPSDCYQSLESEPHLIFRPGCGFYELLADIVTWNFLHTKVMAYALRNTNAYVATLEGLRPEYLGMLQEMFGTEGEGAKLGLIFDLPKPGVGQISIMPHVEKMPFDLDAALMEMIRMNEEDIKRHAPSRFQTGAASRTEVGEAKAQVYVDASQASTLPFVANLANQDSYGTVAELEAVRAGIIYFDKDTPARDQEKIYPYMVTGEEPLMRGGPDAPDSGFVGASTMKRKHQIFAQTKNQTQAEEQIVSLIAAQDETNGLITFEQHLIARGTDDVHKQLYELERDRQRKDLEPQKRQLITLTNNAMFLAWSGANFAKLAGLPTPAPPNLPGTPAFPGPVEQTVPRSGTGVPNYKPSFMAEAQPTNGQHPPTPQPAVSPTPNNWGVGSSPTGAPG